MRDANAGLDFHGTGRMVTPFGAEVYCLKEMDSDTLIAIDKNYAFERVIASDITTDFDKRLIFSRIFLTQRRKRDKFRFNFT